MDFQLTEKQKLLQANARAFIQREIVPIAQERDTVSVAIRPGRGADHDQAHGR
jgi:hypothetical protein